MGKGKGGIDSFKKPGGIMKIFQFILPLGAFISILIGNNGNWHGDVVLFFNITCIIGFGYALGIIICIAFDLVDVEKAKWETVVCICISILSFIAASIYSLSFTYYCSLNTSSAICYQAATVLEFLAGFAYLIGVVLGVMEIGG